MAGTWGLQSACPLLATITLGVLHMIEVRQHRLLRSPLVQHQGCSYGLESEFSALDV